MEENQRRGYPDPIRPGHTRIGWIGPGIMGSPMAARLISAGYRLTVYARTPSKAAHLLRLGAALAPSPADAARSADVVFTIVSRTSDVRSVLLHPSSGALASLPTGGVLVDCTTCDPALAREVAAAARARGCWSVDAPVSGADVGAREGRLAIFAGGEEAVVRWLAPLFDLLGRATWLGPAGCGQSAKLANQVVGAGSLMGLSEAALFAERAGLGVAEFVEAVRGGAAGTNIMEIFGERVAGRDFAPGGFAEYYVKDLEMALEEAGVKAGAGEQGRMSVAAALPGTALCRQLYSGMIANGDHKMGLHGLITVLERMNGKREGN
ncbi:probable 3-hydroxyisobutyrate dehydrogenase-like 2, mitochondrial [Zingiber officinale]|uniref:Uncharacterized protein n=1 Tax=Zingiber officinale TaxID=94328 RepID=A0A8J5HQB5_ZINOF|nr:probable 3-hydroxyisobutyrate dehydrogenase-like 2, mitochondrial [Zingiber officinale]KAG6533062.1 hypothetical protein ZIOFF_006923 [Zingiber officinale]